MGISFYKMQKMAGTIISAKAKQNAEDYNCKPRLNSVFECILHQAEMQSNTTKFNFL